MQTNDPPKAMRYEFTRSSEEPEALKFEKRLDKLPDKAREQYDKVCRDQARSLDHFEQQLADGRGRKVDRMTQDILDRKRTNPGLHLTRDDPSSASEKKLRQYAREEAEIAVDQQDACDLSLVEARYLQERYELVSDLEHYGKCLNDFNQSRDSKDRGSKNNNGEENER